MNHFKQSCAAVLLSLSWASGVTAQAKPANDKDFDSEIESVRADIRADKVVIITSAMNLTPQESSLFWPIYKKYEYDLATLNDERVQLTKSYADKFGALTDAEAKTMGEKALELASRRVDLKKKYFAEFNQKLPPTTVAKFFQLEYRLDLLVDMKVASELPGILVKSSPTISGQR